MSFFSEDKAREFINSVVDEMLAADNSLAKKTIAANCDDGKRHLKPDEFTKVLNGTLKIFPIIELLAKGLNLSPYEIFFAQRLPKDFIKRCDNLHNVEEHISYNYVSFHYDNYSSPNSDSPISYYYKGTGKKLSEEDVMLRKMLKELFDALDSKKGL